MLKVYNVVTSGGQGEDVVTAKELLPDERAALQDAFYAFMQEHPEIEITEENKDEIN